MKLSQLSVAIKTTAAESLDECRPAHPMIEDSALVDWTGYGMMFQMSVARTVNIKKDPNIR